MVLPHRPAAGEEPPADGAARREPLRRAAARVPAVRPHDRAVGRVPAAAQRQELRIVSPERYVDESGAFRVRFVNRGDQTPAPGSASRRASRRRHDRDRPHRGPHPPLWPHGRGGGRGPDGRGGEIFGLVGPNGAGKTTTLRMLATLLVPTRGDARIMGHSIRHDPDEVRRVIGYMPDTFGVYDDMRVWEYLDFFARCYAIPGARRKRLVGDLLELVDLAPQARRLRPVAVAGHAAAAVPRPRAGPRPAACCCSTSRPRAWTRARASSCASCCASCAPWARPSSSAATSCPSSRSCAPRVAIIDHGRVLARGEVAEIERRLRRGAVLRVTVLGDAEALAAASERLPPTPWSTLRDDPARWAPRARAPGRRGRHGRPARPRHPARTSDRRLRARRERPRGAVPPGHRAPRAERRDARAGAGGARRHEPAVAGHGLRARGQRRHQQGAARPDARPAGVRHPHHLPAAAGRLRVRHLRLPPAPGGP